MIRPAILFYGHCLKQSQLLGFTVKITSLHLPVTVEVKKRKGKYHNFSYLLVLLNSPKCSKITQASRVHLSIFILANNKF